MPQEQVASHPEPSRALLDSGRSSEVADTVFVVLVAALPVAFHWLRGFEHTAADLGTYFLPNLDWLWNHATGRGAWNPWIFGGYPLGADPQVSGQHPFDWLYGVLPLPAAAAVEEALCPAMAAVGMRLYLRRLGCSRAAAIVGAVAFGLGGFVASRAPHLGLRRTAAAIPWALLATESCAGLRFVVALSVALLAVVLGGHPQGSVLGATLLGAYALSFGPHRFHTRVALVLCAGALAAAASASWWIPAAELYLESTRRLESSPFPNPMLRPAELVRLIVPLAAGGSGELSGTVRESLACSAIECMTYPGYLALVTALVAVPLAARLGRATFWVVVAVLSLLLSSAASAHLLAGLSLRGPSRFLLWWSVAVSALAALGFDRVMARERRALGGAAATVAILAVALGWLLLQQPGARVVLAAAAAALGLATVALVGLMVSGERWRPLAAKVAVVVLVADLWMVGQDLSLGAVPAGHVEERRTSLSWLARVVDESQRSRALVIPMTLSANWAPEIRLRMVQGYNPLVPEPPAHLLDQAYRVGLDAVGAVGSPDVVQSDDVALDLLRVDTVAVRHDAPKSTIAQELARLADGGARWSHVPNVADGFTVYRNDRARPVAWFVDDVRVLGSEAEIRATVHGRHDGPAFDPTREALVTNPTELLPTGDCPPGRATVARYEDEEILLDVETECPRLLVTSEWAYPGWTARIDDREARVLDVNGGFRAVVSPAGKRRVLFRFEPAWSTAARVISWFGVLTLLSLAAVSVRRGVRTDTHASGASASRGSRA